MFLKQATPDRQPHMYVEANHTLRPDEADYTRHAHSSRGKPP